MANENTEKSKVELNMEASEISAEVPEEEKSEKKAAAWWQNKKARYGLVAGACALVIAGGGVAIAAMQPAPAEEQAQVAAKTEQVAAKASVDADVAFDLDGFDWAVPVLLRVTDEAGGVTYVAYATPDGAKLTLPDATYTVSAVSPITADGSIYITSDPATVDKTTDTIAITGTKLPAEDVTEDQINAIKDAYSKAKDAGNVDASTVDKVTNNANAGAEARASKTDEEKKAAQENAKQETEAKQEASASSNSGSANASGNSSSNNSSSTPAHTHSWTPVYTTVHHDAVTHEEPVYSKVAVGSDAFCTKHGTRLLTQRWADTGSYCSSDKNCFANTTVKEIYEDRQTGTKSLQIVQHMTSK